MASTSSLADPELPRIPPGTRPQPDSISAQSRRHLQMRKDALKAHPHLRHLAGADRRTALAVPLLLAIHWSIAWAVSGSNLLVCFLLCWGHRPLYVSHIRFSLIINR